MGGFNPPFFIKERKGDIMDKDTKIKIKNTTNGRVGIKIPELRLQRTWERKNAIRDIDFDTLSQAIYYPGVEYMFRQGILYIDDMEAKIALGLEEEGAEVPQNIIVLDDSQKERYMKNLPLAEFRTAVAKLSWEQVQDLTDYAIANECVNIDKAEILKDYTQVDIIRAIQLNRADKEEVKAGE